MGNPQGVSFYKLIFRRELEGRSEARRTRGGRIPLDFVQRRQGLAWATCCSLRGASGGRRAKSCELSPVLRFIHQQCTPPFCLADLSSEDHAKEKALPAIHSFSDGWEAGGSGDLPRGGPRQFLDVLVRCHRAAKRLNDGLPGLTSPYEIEKGTGDAPKGEPGRFCLALCLTRVSLPA
jgi:hypothetical protein